MSTESRQSAARGRARGCLVVVAGALAVLTGGIVTVELWERPPALLHGTRRVVVVALHWGYEHVLTAAGLAVVVGIVGVIVAIVGVIFQWRFGREQPPRDVRSLQKQRHPIRSVGTFLGASPPMPARFIPRPQELERLLTALQDGDSPAVALVGMGGVGKTVLASVAAHDPSIQRRFADGVAWLTVGQQPDIVGLQSRLAQLLGEAHPQFTTKEAGRDLLASLLSGRDVLLVLDNVWDRAALDAFAGLASGCVILFTARYSQLARDIDAVRLEIAQLTLEQALALLARWTNSHVDALPPVADRLCLRVDNLALGVAMVGAMLAQPGRTWQDILLLLESADLAQIKADFGEEYPHPNLLAAIELSIDDLPDQPTRQRYRELAVFAGQGAFPRAAVEALWAPTGPTGPRVGELLATLAGRSLLSDEGDGWFGIHDLQLDVISKQLGAARLREAHQQLLDSYLTHCPAGWPTGPNDGYFLEHLAFHLSMADRRPELSQLLTDLNWMLVKLTTTGLAGLLADFSYDHDTPTSQAVQVALQLSAAAVAASPDQLPGQLVGRLVSHPDPAIRAVAGAISGWAEAPWLCPLTRPGLAPAAGPQRYLLLGHSAGVEAVAVTPDGRSIVSGSQDNTVRVWDLASGRPIRTLRGHTNSVSSVAVTSDSQLVVSGSWDKTARIWNLASGRLVRTLEDPNERVDAVALTPDNQFVLSGGKDGIVRVWDLASGQLVRTLKCHKVNTHAISHTVNTLAISTDSQLVVSGCSDGTMQLWNLASGQLICPLESQSDSVLAVTVTPDNQCTVASRRDVRVLDLPSGQLIRILEGHKGPATAVVVSRDNKLIASGSSDRTVRVWDRASGQLLRTLETGSGPVRGVAVSPDNELIIAANGAAVLVFQLATKPIPPANGHSERVLAIAVTTDNRTIVSGSMDNTVRIWDLASGQLVRTLEGHSGGVDTVAVSRDNKVIVSGSRDRTVRIWELASGRLVRTLEGHSHWVSGVAVTSDNRMIVSGSSDKTVRIWDLASGQLVRSLEGHTEMVDAVALTPDNRFVLSGGKDGIVRVWELASGRLVRTLEGHSHAVVTLAVSPDSEFIVSGSMDKTVKVWTLASGRLTHTMEGHTAPVEDVAISPNNRQIVSSGLDKTLRVWDAITGREVARWTSDYNVHACATACGRLLTIAVGDQSGLPYVLQLRGTDAF
jgi:WD40 repeat protein